MNEVSVEASERRRGDAGCERTVGVSKQAARPDAEVVFLEQGAAGPPQDGKQWSWSLDTSWAEAASLHYRPGIKYVKAGMETWNGGNREPTRAAVFLRSKSNHSSEEKRRGM